MMCRLGGPKHGANFSGFLLEPTQMLWTLRDLVEHNSSSSPVSTFIHWGFVAVFHGSNYTFVVGFCKPLKQNTFSLTLSLCLYLSPHRKPSPRCVYRCLTHALIKWSYNNIVSISGSPHWAHHFISCQSNLSSWLQTLGHGWPSIVPPWPRWGIICLLLHYNVALVVKFWPRGVFV